MTIRKALKQKNILRPWGGPTGTPNTCVYMYIFTYIFIKVWNTHNNRLTHENNYKAVKIIYWNTKNIKRYSVTLATQHDAHVIYDSLTGLAAISVFLGRSFREVFWPFKGITRKLIGLIGLFKHISCFDICFWRFQCVFLRPGSTVYSAGKKPPNPN